jgi:hypothetical protein
MLFSQWADVVSQAKPRIAFILGSGMGALASRLANPLSLSFDDIPAFAGLPSKGIEAALHSVHG